MSAKNTNPPSPDTHDSTRLALITVVYNTYEILDEFFASFDRARSAAPTIEPTVYVADLSDRAQDYDYPSYVQTISGENKGYAHGVNLGVIHALRDDHTQFCIINSDIVFAESFLTATADALNDNPGTIIGGKIWYAPGYEYHSDRYTPAEQGTVIWYAGGEIDWGHVITHHRGVDEVDTGQYDHAGSTEFVTGCLMAYDRAVIETVGLWDESFFLYYEDAEFCVRATKADVPIRYEPSIQIWHKNAQSTDGSGSSIHQKYQSRNRLRFGLRYAPWRTKLHLLKNAVMGRN